ncbi:hypothetical protein M8A54_000365 [Salmonella enterica]|nr:hypothetical protein [Salmonella enterica]
MRVNNMTDLTPGIVANKTPVTPEQMLVICTELEALTNKADANTRHNQKSQALEYIKGWINSNKKRAMNEINKRGVK